MRYIRRGSSRRCGEMADALDLKSKDPLTGRVGSTPTSDTSPPDIGETTFWRIDRDLRPPTTYSRYRVVSHFCHP